MVRVPFGSVKNQLMTNDETTAQAMAGSRPPTSAVATVSERNSSTSSGSSCRPGVASRPRVTTATPTVASSQPPQRRRGSEAVVAEPQTLDAAAGVADQVHVDVAGCRGHLLADAASSEPGQPRAAARPDDDLGGVHAAGDVEDRLGDVAPGHLVHHAAELLDQLSLRSKGFRVGVDETVGS